MLEIGLVFGSVGLLVGALSTVAVMRLVARARLQQLELERRIEREHARLQLETLHERLSHQQEQREQLELTFRGLAAETLNASTREFKGQAERALQSLLQPLGLELRTFREAVQQSGKETFALKQHVDRLGQQSVALSDQAQQLTTALKGDLRVQGAWGELMLERVLELSGLVAGREYQLQLHVAGPDGAARPDAVIFLPDDRRLVIDAKVSLTAYERYSRAEDDGAADEAQRAHAQSLRSHIKQLAEKRYAER
ncbi:MAG: DNA recombination protein RmuC, partial [Myxococcales bacterium]|nr:DNA recombination protein RmuC [Myxococcales bacterium]